MRFHVTCGRGTEVFVQQELLAKINAKEILLEDGKVFFTVDTDSILPGTAHDNEVSRRTTDALFGLKSVERIFATVAHFPTSDIKGQGKVKFLQLLKGRILNQSSLEQAAVCVCHLRKLVHSTHSDRNPYSTQHCQESCVDTQGDTGETVTQQNGDLNHHKATAEKSPSYECDTCASELPSGIGTVRQTFDASKCRHKRSADCVYTESDKEDEVLAKKQKHSMNTQDVVSTIPSNTGQGLNSNISVASPENAQPLALPVMSGENMQSAIQSVGSSNWDCAENSIEINHRRTSEREDVCGVNDPDTKTPLSFRFSVKCGGWCKKWLQPQRLAKELGIRLHIMLKWNVDLTSPDLEICVHVNDDVVTVGIPLTSMPLSKREYIAEAGLRSTVSWIMASLADIQPGDVVLDPMCGKSTILLEAAKAFPLASVYMGCDCDRGQLQTASRNVKFAQLEGRVHLLQADALCKSGYQLKAFQMANRKTEPDSARNACEKTIRKGLPLKSDSVDRIVCDAPFGQKFLVTSGSLQDFYSQLLKEQFRVLVAGGTIILLTSQDLLSAVQANTTQQANATQQANTTQQQANATQQANTTQQANASQQANATPSHHSEKAVNTNNQESTETAQSMDSRSDCHKPTTSATQSSKFGLTSQHSDCHKPVRSDMQSSKFALTSQSDGVGDKVFNSDVEEARLLTRHAVDQFYLQSSHYVKLGETHAYIVVLKKPS